MGSPDRRAISPKFLCQSAERSVVVAVKTLDNLSLAIGQVNQCLSKAEKGTSTIDGVLDCERGSFLETISPATNRLVLFIDVGKNRRGICRLTKSSQPFCVFAYGLDHRAANAVICKRGELDAGAMVERIGGLNESEESSCDELVEREQSLARARPRELAGEGTHQRQCLPDEHVAYWIGRSGSEV